MLKEVAQTTLISVAVAKCNKTRELGEGPGVASIATSGEDCRTDYKTGCEGEEKLDKHICCKGQSEARGQPCCNAVGGSLNAQPLAVLRIPLD